LFIQNGFVRLLTVLAKCATASGYFSMSFHFSVYRTVFSMRAYPVLVVCLVLSLRLWAQLPDGSIAPDFQVVDIKGQNWHLYDLLAQDKIVLIEISATWCPPCWSYHNSQALQNFYKVHGPAGDDRARVLFVEGDPNTNLNCLYGQTGCNNISPGDWVTGSPYPIIDNADIAKSFEVQYYPTIFVICPNKKLYEVGQVSAGDLWGKAQSCPVAKGMNNAGMFDYDSGSLLHEVCDTLSLAPRFTLINLGANPLIAASVDLKWNGSTVQNIFWTGGLPLYGEIQIKFDSIAVAEPGQLTTIVTEINYGTVEADSSNNSHTDLFTAASTFNSQAVLLRIRTDQYGAETYWELRDEQGKVLDYGGNKAVGPNGGGTYFGANGGPGAYGNYALIKDTLLLPAGGCYSLHFVDAYGDGMCCEYGNGYYRLYNLGNSTSIIMGGGDFGAYDRRAFGAQATVWLEDVSDEKNSRLHLYPNPATDVLYVETNWLEITDVRFSVLNTLGQVVRSFATQCIQPNGSPTPLDVAGLPAGTYFLRADVPGSVRTEVFVRVP